MTTRAVGLRRLTTLADFLDTLPRERFDYTRWVGSDWKGAPDLSCGTTACAAGWATTIPAFRRAGLRLKRVSWSVCGGGVVAFGSRVADRALASFFALTYEQAVNLFFPSSILRDETHATPQYVAHKIRRFVKQQEGK